MVILEFFETIYFTAFRTTVFSTAAIFPTSTTLDSSSTSRFPSSAAFHSSPLQIFPFRIKTRFNSTVSWYPSVSERASTSSVFLSCLKCVVAKHVKRTIIFLNRTVSFFWYEFTRF